MKNNKMVQLIYLLVSTHLTILSVTLYLHRSQAHRAVEFHPVVSHGMRFWLWLTTGMITREWVAVHRRHHQYSDLLGDPHSPHTWGIWRVLTQGALLYQQSARDRQLVHTLGRGTPQDWVERQVYQEHSKLGVTILLAILLLCWGWLGALIWVVQMIWIPFWAAGVINGLGHWWGYRSYQTRDCSHNLVPWGVIVGGEELHNNHHQDPASPRLSRQWWEFDEGWMWIKVLCWLRLARLTRSKSA